jgi:hypothetical protein
MGVFKICLTKFPSVFSKAMFGLGVGWIHFHNENKTSS